MPEKLWTDTDNEISYLMISGFFHKVEVADLTQLLAEKEVGINDLYLLLTVLSLISISPLPLFLFVPLSHEQILQLLESLLIELLRVDSAGGHVSFFFLHQPLVHSHKVFGRCIGVNGFSFYGLVPVYLLFVGHFGFFDQPEMPFLHESEYFRELVLVLDEDFESTHG